MSDGVQEDNTGDVSRGAKSSSNFPLVDGFEFYLGYRSLLYGGAFWLVAEFIVYLDALGQKRMEEVLGFMRWILWHVVFNIILTFAPGSPLSQ